MTLPSPETETPSAYTPPTIGVVAPFVGLMSKIPLAEALTKCPVAGLVQMPCPAIPGLVPGTTPADDPSGLSLKSCAPASLFPAYKVPPLLVIATPKKKLEK